ncbi:MAG: hypothetical protein FWC78_03255 [Defluviitaleaceae bacterium]|nr:hypothetical protein [Defluviitaleaceae bacterium]
MPGINKEEMYAKFNSRQPQAAQALVEYIGSSSAREGILHFIDWLQAKGVTPQYADYENQSPVWEVNYRGKAFYLVLNGQDNVCIMGKVAFSEESQAVMRDNNMEETVLGNLQYCTRKDGGHCGNCDLPAHIAGVDEVIFGQEIKGLCCGQFVTFENPGSVVVEGVIKLLEL